MPLQSDIQQIRYNAAGADLITQSQMLRSQSADTEAEIATLRPQIRADIAADNWQRSDIERIIELFNLRDSLNLQKSNCKTAIRDLWAVIADQNYKDELEAEEGLL